MCWPPQSDVSCLLYQVSCVKLNALLLSYLAPQPTCIASFPLQGCSKLQFLPLLSCSVLSHSCFCSFSAPLLLCMGNFLRCANLWVLDHKGRTQQQASLDVSTSSRSGQLSGPTCCALMTADRCILL